MLHRRRIAPTLALLVLALAGPRARADWSLTAIASFDGTSGANPSSLVADASGNLYGTAYTGGDSNYGTVFEVARGSNTITSLAMFDNSTTGAYPNGALVLDASGNLYGATNSGGDSNRGTVFEIATGSNTITTLASFNNTNGDGPNGHLLLDASGNLYGTAYRGGNAGYGTVFEIEKGSNAITPLASFDGPHGAYPNGGLALDASGNLYGTTSNGGGASDSGTVFEILKGSNTITTLAAFNGINGDQPGGVVLDAAGNLYGTTKGGGTNGGYGTVFEIARGSNTITILASFNNTNGSAPIGGLTFDGSGNLYGTTGSGGVSDSGTVFEVVKDSGAIRYLASFNDPTTGSSSQGGLVLDDAGNLYGAAAYGGASGYGTVFQVSPAAVPEPSSLALTGTGLVLIGLAARRRRRNRG